MEGLRVQDIGLETKLGAVQKSEDDENQKAEEKKEELDMINKTEASLNEFVDQFLALRSR